MKLNKALRILELCEERDMSQYQLFRASGVSQSTLSTIKNCTFPSMKLRILYEICEGLEISLTDLLILPFLSEKTSKMIKTHIENFRCAFLLFE